MSDLQIKKFWDEAVSFDEYLRKGKEIVEHPPAQLSKEYHEYYRLGLHRMNRMLKVYHPDKHQSALLAEKNFTGKILVISEQWCGDASQAIPVIHLFFKENEFRITYRDQSPSLIDDFLTNGSMSIPIVLFLDKSFQVIAQWGPRPAFGKSLFEKYKSNPLDYTKDQMHLDLQKYYAENKGYDTIQEILTLL